MSIPIEILDALVASGCTAAQVVAAIRADRDRLAMLRMRRQMQRIMGGVRQGDARPIASPVLAVAKPDSAAPASPVFRDPGELRSAPIKSQARHGVLTTLTLKKAERAVAALLIEHLNLTTGRCDPGIPGMARRLGLTERSVRRALEGLEGLGLVRRAIHAGRGLSNAYTLDLEAMARLAVPIGQKPDSAENRTLESAKPDGRVRLNRVQKQFSEVPRARPDPQQREMFFPMPADGQRRASAILLGAHRRILDDLAAAQLASPGFNVSSLTEADWESARAGEARKRGDGIAVIRQRLGTGPPKAASG